MLLLKAGHWSKPGPGLGGVGRGEVACGRSPTAELGEGVSGGEGWGAGMARTVVA